MNPFDLILWTIAIGISWVVFTSLIAPTCGIRKWINQCFESESSPDLISKVADLEKRIEILEKNSKDNSHS